MFDGMAQRAFMLEDITIRSGGDGRTVEAYASAFDVPYEVRDSDGHYFEVIRSHAFNRTLRDLSAVQVLFNHGRTTDGTPSERYSMPLGTPLEVKVDGRGLFTVTRYSKTSLADEVLELIRDGAIRGQSWSGKFMPGQSKRTAPAKPGGLPTIERNEIKLREYGPTPFPASLDARVVGVRSLAFLTEAQVNALQNLGPDQITRLVESATADTPDGPAGDGNPDPDPPAASDTPDDPATVDGGPSVSGPSPALLAEQRKRRRKTRRPN